MNDISYSVTSGNAPVAPMQYNLAAAYVQALTGSPDTPMDWRALHDTDKSLPGHARRGPLSEWWGWLCALNGEGYGIFCNVSAMDGNGRELANVQSIRAHYVDLDGPDAQQQYERAIVAHPAPAFAVMTSGSKYHIYWTVTPYLDATRFTAVQRRLASVFNGDRKVIDPTRVLRLPGLYHCKGDPVMVTCHALAGYGAPTTLEALEQSLAHVQVIDGGDGERLQLGDPSMAAPSLDWVQFALDLSDPNGMDRDEWFGLTCSIKQAGWTLTDEATLRSMWDKWCARYEHNVPGENAKMWDSITSTELGWKSLLRRVPSLQASVSFGPDGPVVPAMPVQGAATVQLGEILTGPECAIWFDGCRLIGPDNLIVDRKGISYGPGAFNAAFGGKRFIVSRDGGKVTDEPWKAATRSTIWTVPKVDGTTFRTDQEPGAVTTDELGRTAVNVYVPATIERLHGDPSPFVDHLKLVIPDDNDRSILIEYLAHNVKYPGYKIPWAPLIQSVQGVGKNLIKHVMTHAMGTNYVYNPKAMELADGGSKFNAWMERRLLLIADEIKTDDKRVLLEIMKDMITEDRLEMQRKGFDQRMGDNIANWVFFTNHKDAIPITTDDRRYSIFFSPFQSSDDLLQAGLNDAYFKNLYDGFLGQRSHRRGLRIAAGWLMDYPIERGAIPMRAPKTTSWLEAIEAGRGWLEALIADAAESSADGFKHGWVNTAAVGRVLREARKSAEPTAIGKALRNLGFTKLKPEQAPRGWWQDDPVNPNKRGRLYHRDPTMNPDGYTKAQGYE